MMKKRIITLLLCTTCLTATMTSQAVVATVPGSVTFDPSGWLSAIDEVYATYDMVTNTITQIENQYKQIKHAIDSAKSIDWNIHSDGDWDIRNEIRDATSKVDNLLTSVRRVKNTLSSPFVNMNGYGYSLADICGCGDDGKNFATAIEDMGKEIESHFKDFCLGVAGQMTPEQRKAIYTKYGVTPENYVMVQQTVDMVHNACSKIFSKANDEAEKVIVEEQVAKTNKILNGTYATVDENGNPTQAALSEGTMLLMEQVVNQMLQAQMSINDLSNMVATDMLNQEKTKQVKLEEANRQVQIEKNTDNKTSSRFKL